MLEIGKCYRRNDGEVFRILCIAESCYGFDVPVGEYYDGLNGGVSYCYDTGNFTEITREEWENGFGNHT